MGEDVGSSGGRPKWRPDAEGSICEECGEGFSFFNRRHHCRKCGGLFCGKCSGAKRLLSKELGYGSEPQRVCKPCARSLDPPPGSVVTSGFSSGNSDRKDPVVKQRKICVLGKSWVGKSAICVRFIDDRFSPYYNPTINHTYQRQMKHKGQQYLLSILDTAGQDECSMFQPQYSIGTHGYIIVYSINDYHSFEMVKSIYDRIQDCNILDGVVLILVGNKSDLPSSERQVSHEEGQQLAGSWGVPFMECSAKQSDTVEGVFNLMLEEILKAEGDA
uniref:GTP-binding protein Rheb isoform 1 n=1 Tax=Rhynchopus euleeides TaxID=630703 RepID=A0A2R4IKW5_9EUGL|nr:GTP-binding protein Rheb isoform 1 [Rhynchopus euleeides]